MDPLLAFGFWAFVLTFAGIYAIFVLGLQLEVGDTGLINFGHVAFMAIGAYTMGLLVTNDVTIWVAIPIAIAAAAAGGLLLGLPTLRLRADYFAIVTIAAGEILRITIQNEEPTTGGTQGLRSASGPWRDANNDILDFFSNMYIFNTLITGQWAAFVDASKHMILPAIAVGTIPLAIIARMTRSSLLEVLGLDYVRTARAKGLKERSVVVRHGMRNALLPVVTVIGLSLGAFLSGAILTETIFNLTGMGKTLFEAISGRDYIVVQGVTLVVAIAYLVVNLLVDVSYGFLDPRIRLE